MSSSYRTKHTQQMLGSMSSPGCVRNSLILLFFGLGAGTVSSGFLFTPCFSSSCCAFTPTFLAPVCFLRLFSACCRALISAFLALSSAFLAHSSAFLFFSASFCFFFSSLSFFSLILLFLPFFFSSSITNDSGLVHIYRYTSSSRGVSVLGLTKYFNTVVCLSVLLMHFFFSTPFYFSFATDLALCITSSLCLPYTLHLHRFFLIS